jgi:hypothetical protein
VYGALMLMLMSYTGIETQSITTHHWGASEVCHCTCITGNVRRPFTKIVSPTARK